MRRLRRCAAICVWLVGSLAAVIAIGQEPGARKQVWTKEQALGELRLRPHDPYVQYVAAQLSLLDGTRQQVREQIEPLLSRRQQAAARNRSVDLLSIFSGSLAVQESLQLDALTQPPAAGALDEAATVSIESLHGPSVESHPWTKMLAGQQPKLSLLAECIPADQLYVRFESVSKLLAMRRLAHDYAAYVNTQTQHRAFSAGLIDQAQKQLAVEINPSLQPLYDAAIAEVAITSSDLYFGEGTDIALVMRLNESNVIRGQLDGFLQNAQRASSDAKSEEGEYLGVPFKHVRTPDRAVHVFSAYPKPNLHVRTNSRAALERLLSAILDKPYRGNAVETLGDTDEFRYIRTLMPLGADDEDGFIYMSDPFIRKLIGAEKKLTQRRRLLCRSHLQMIAYAGLLYQTQFGRRASSLDQLHESGCLGVPDEPLEIHCPSGGEYRLAEDGLHGQCSLHGDMHAMVPCNEIPLVKASPREAEEYREFEQEYSQYWRTYFDPIAIRLKQSPEQTRIETIVLPLINNSIYQGLASVLGGEPENLDALPIPKRNIFSVAMRIDKERVLAKAGIKLPDAPPNPELARAESVSEVVESLWQIGLAMHNFYDANKHLPPNPSPTNSAQPSGLSWRVQILPFLGLGELYNQFKLDEPWDSEHNRALIERMPEIYGSANTELAKQGKTRLVRPFHADALYHARTQGADFVEITDGLSNTLMAVVADEDRAVIWTKPDDLELDLANPRNGWSKGVGPVVPVLFGDGSVRGLPRSTPDEQVKALITRAGNEALQTDFERLTRSRGSNRLLPLLDELRVPEFLYKGLGNQIGIHVCDADPLVDFSVPRFLGMVAGTFNGRSSFMRFDESALFVVLGMAINVPVYISAPVQDAEIVDGFLERLDRFLARAAREQSQRFDGFFSVEHDFYEVKSEADKLVRAYAFHFGPLTWRFYWMRIGDGLYVASKPFIIAELREATDRAVSDATAHAHPTQAAHGMVRVRPEHWDQVRAHYRIGWAESERLACLRNLGPIADLGRALASSQEQAGQDDENSREALHKLAHAVFRAEYRCPAGGEYHFDDEHGASCSVHGTLAAPLQPTTTAESTIFQLIDALRDVSLDLRFLEDGLHAVVTIERDPRGRFK